MTDIYAHHQGIAAVLEAGGFAFGDHIAPPDEPPYVVLYLRNTVVDGTAANPDELLRQRFQTTSVGRTASEALDWDHKAQVALGAAVTVAGRYLQRIEDTGFDGVNRDEDSEQPLFYAVHHFAAWSFPS